MRIVIDLQGAQTESRFRGVGRYSLAIAKAMVKQGGEHELIVLLNSALSDSIPFLRRQFEDILPQSHFRIWNGLPRTRARDAGNEWRQAATALSREAYIAALEADAVFVPGFFEGYVDDAVLSAKRLFDVPTFITLHDLIPLLNPETYLDHDPRFKAFYQAKIADIKASDALIAVSDSAAGEATSLLHFDASRITNASEAADTIFRPLGLTSDASRQLRSQFGIGRPYIFYAGGGDLRKNLDRLIQAYAALPDAVRKRHQLVIAGRMTSGERAPLDLTATRSGLNGDDLVFLDYVSDTDLVKLYNDCALCVMPSLHEGFGLPALEAMQCGAPTIGSSTSSIPEVIGLADALFDPLSVPAMTARIGQALEDPAFRNMLARHGLAQSQKFSWEASATRILEIIGKAAAGTSPAREWDQWVPFADGLEQKLLEAIAALDGAGQPTDRDLADISQAIADDRVGLEAAKRSIAFPGKQSWRLEGPFDSSYSLALVNRELARSLARQGHSVELHSAEGGGDFAPSEAFLARDPEIGALYDRGTPSRGATVVSRNMYPPRVEDMSGRINLLHNYAWEETGFPHDWVDGFNDYLQGLTVTSAHVKKVLVDNGVTAPIAVVGNGVDHWQSVVANPAYGVQAKSFRFLHVSSCFPRKGVDILLKAFAEAFTADDDVSLIIKTFPNPHNTVRQQVAGLAAQYPRLADIVVIEDDLDEACLKALYEQCQVLVAPSRAEGFGLPLAEALLSGLAVIATGWSGQLEFLKEDPSSLVDFEFTPAETHMEVFNSVWAEPSLDHLKSRLIEAVGEAPAARKARVAVLRERLLRDFSWANVARNNGEAAAAFGRNTVSRRPSIAWVSTFAARCGIATYSQHLIDTLAGPVEIFAAHDAENLKAEDYNFSRCWKQGDGDLTELTRGVLASNSDVVVLQFNYGFFDFPALRTFLRAVHDSGRVLVVTLHSTKDPQHDPSKRLADLVAELSLCARILVHSVGDLNRLKAVGLVDNVTLFPHGVLDLPVARTRTSPARANDVVIASYGFFLPNKGLLELIEAFAIMARNGFKGRLRMVNAEFPVVESASLIQEARRLISHLGLRGSIELHTDFLSDEQSLALLASANLVVYPYQQTGESSSGAVRYGLASEVPVATTPLAIFDDVGAAVFRLPGFTPTLIAEGITDLLDRRARRDEGVEQKMQQAAQWRQAHAYSRLGRRLSGMLLALANPLN